MQQFKDFIKHKIPNSVLKIIGSVYGHTARMLAELPYTNSSIALDLKLAKA
jgi:hypothetical protein